MKRLCNVGRYIMSTYTELSDALIIVYKFLLKKNKKQCIIKTIAILITEEYK